MFSIWYLYDNDLTLIHIITETEPSDDNTAAEQSGGNTFSTNEDDNAKCEHRSRNRVVIADNSDFANSPIQCSYCDRPALGGTELKWTIVCQNCGATICKNCNKHNSDSDKDSDIYYSSPISESM